MYSFTPTTCKEDSGASSIRLTFICDNPALVTEIAIMNKKLNMLNMD